MSERKRKHEAVSEMTSADDDRKPSAVAAADCSSVGGGTKKSAKLKEASDTPRCSTFSDLPPGIVGKISTYISLRAYGNGRDRRTLMSLCTAVGPSISSYIRKSYLEGNLSFLYYLNLFVPYNDTAISDAECAVVGAKLRQWMEYNPWWREACQSPSAFMAKQQRHHPTIYKLIRVKEFENEVERESFLQDVCITRTGQVYIYGGSCGIGVYNLVVSVNDKALPFWPTSKAYRDAILASGSDAEVLVMQQYFGLFFLNPALSINLGLLELLRFQLEDLALDVNCQKWTGPRIGEVELPLILHSMVQEDACFFEYLLSFNGIVLNPILKMCPMTDNVFPDGLGMTLLHCLHAVIGGSLNGKFDLNRLKQLLSHDDVDINRGLEDTTFQEVITPLYTTLTSPIKFDSDFDVVKIYVEAGAEVDRALSVASSREYDRRFEQGFEQGFGMTLPHLNERIMRPIRNDGSDVAVMRAKHQRLIGAVRQLIGESGQE